MTATPAQYPGSAHPLGATVTQRGVNFAVYSRHADRLFLCLFDEQGKEKERIPFTHKTQHVWHMEVSGLTSGQHYGLRAEGPFEQQNQHLFNVEKLLIDPYARKLTGKLKWHPDQCAMDSQGQPLLTDSAHCVPKAIVSDRSERQVQHTSCVPSERVLYELHIKGFSQQLLIEADLQGKYLGVISDPGIQHLKSLGVTSIQIMPCFAFMTEPRLQQLGLKNYWGYNPYHFFVPEADYAIDDPVSECQQMIDGLHAAGFEVILDVVYNHTAESEMHLSSVSFRGLDNADYYRHQGDHYLNYTGCGNCLDCYQPVTTRLIMDSMRYWVEEMGVDGFRFDLGVDLGRTDHQFNAKAPLLQAILQDPVLSRTCLVAEPWDIGPFGYQLGQFPAGFLQCNDQYRDSIRRFWRGDEGQVQALATRLMGSRDLFHKGHLDALHSVNYITYHDGFTLRDLVTYHRRHNLANMEENRDGHGDNISQNFGHEGETEAADIRLRRLNQIRCFLATLLLSQGTPHLLGGDELHHSQQGNNNAYCQDNRLTWQDWQMDEHKQNLQDTVASLIALRKRFPVLAECRLDDDALYRHQSSDLIEWVNESGLAMSHDDWHEMERDYLGLVMTEASSGAKLWIGIYRDDQPLFAALPEGVSHIQLLFQTGSVVAQTHAVECLQRSVFVALCNA